jgi:hypothetical protein
MIVFQNLPRSYLGSDVPAAFPPTIPATIRTIRSIITLEDIGHVLVALSDEFATNSSGCATEGASFSSNCGNSGRAGK